MARVDRFVGVSPATPSKGRHGYNLRTSGAITDDTNPWDDESGDSPGVVDSGGEPKANGHRSSGVVQAATERLKAQQQGEGRQNQGNRRGFKNDGESANAGATPSSSKSKGKGRVDGGGDDDDDPIDTAGAGAYANEYNHILAWLCRNPWIVVAIFVMALMVILSFVLPPFTPREAVTPGSEHAQPTRSPDVLPPSQQISGSEVPAADDAVASQQSETDAERERRQRAVLAEMVREMLRDDDDESDDDDYYY